MAERWAVLLLLLVMHCGQSSAGSLTLTELTTHAVLGQPFRFRCDTRGFSGSDTSGVVIFKLNSSPTCVVRRNNCTQLDPPERQEYSCACVNPSGDPVSFFLNITELKNDTLGTWLCEYQIKSNAITLEPTDPTGPDSTTISPADPLTVVEKHNLTLTCTAECVPECTYTWFKVKDDVGVDVKYTGSRSLVLAFVTPETEGSYRCVAENPASRKSENKSVEVKVHNYPRLDTAFPFIGRVQTAVGREETLRVPLRSSPSPSLTWSRVQGGNLQPVRAGELESNMEVKDERSLYSATLHMTVEEGDLGLYCLTASNYVGQSSVYIQLVEEDAAESNNEKTMAITADQDERMAPFGLGLAVGGGVTLVIALLVVFLGYWKHRQIRRDLEHPYASTDKSHLENHNNSAVESHYQELPTPKQHRMLGEEATSLDDLDSLPIYNVVSEKDKEDPKRECCVSVVMGKSLINPMYGSVIGKNLINPMYGSVKPDLLYPSGGKPI